MAGTTPNYALPYPSPPDPADVPADIQALATRLDTVLGQVGARELAYTERATNVAVTGTSAVEVIAGPTISLAAAAPLIVEFMVPRFQPDAAVFVQWQFYDAGTALPGVDAWIGPAVGIGIFVYGRRRVQAAAGNHTYRIAAQQSAAGTSGSTVYAGGSYAPAFLRVSRAA